MAAEMSAFFTSGDTTLYFILNRQSDGYFWNTTDTDFEEGINTSWTAEQYGITATEVGSTGRYQADMPSGISAGIYTYILYQRQGAEQAPSDYRVSGIGVINWDGTQDVGNQAIYSRLGSPAGASVSADIAAVKVDTAATKTKTDFLPSATAGAAGGVFIAGTNAPVTITGSGDALTLTSTGGNGRGLNAQGSGVGAGIRASGGSTGDGISTIATAGSGISASSSTGRGISATGGTNNHGIYAAGTGSGSGFTTAGGLTGHGIYAVGGGTSGNGITATGLTSGHGMSLQGTGSSKHGLYAGGGASGTSDGIYATAGSGGVDIRGNITGTVSGIAGTITTLDALDTSLSSAHGAGSWETATGFSTLTTGDIPTTAEIADRILGRNLAGGSDGGRTLMDALRFLRNRWSRTATTLTVYQEDDTTAAWTSTLTVSAGTNPVTESNPA